MDTPLSRGTQELGHVPSHPLSRGIFLVPFGGHVPPPPLSGYSSLLVGYAFLCISRLYASRGYILDTTPLRGVGGGQLRTLPLKKVMSWSTLLLRGIFLNSFLPLGRSCFYLPPQGGLLLLVIVPLSRVCVSYASWDYMHLKAISN